MARHAQAERGEVWQGMADTALDIIIPTIQGREGSLRRCIESFERHTDIPFNPIVVSDSRTCGWGWRQGIVASTAPYLALVADDLELISDKWFEVCAETVDDGLLPCPRVYRPDGTVESQGGDLQAYGHLRAQHRKDRSPCDFVTVPFVSREQIEKIGMIETQYACDTYISYRGRQLGWETVLRHGYDLVHYQEQAGRGAGMDQNERDAMDTATMRKKLAKHELAANARYVKRPFDDPEWSEEDAVRFAEQFDG